MTEKITYIYKCYLGKELMYRTIMIHEFIEKYSSSFFYTYSTDEDSIIDFIIKCEDMGLL